MLRSSFGKMDVPVIEKLTVDQINRAKHMLNAALHSVMRDKDPSDVAAIKGIIFGLLESDDPNIERVKPSLIEGQFLDAADQLYFLGRKALENRGDYYLKAALLYLPTISFKAVEAFERAEKQGADLKPYGRQLSDLYSRLGDRKKAKFYATFSDRDEKQERPGKTQSPKGAQIIPLPFR